MKSTADYQNNFQYENGVLQFIAQPEGYIYKDATGYRYVYQYKGHLGNNRLSFMRNAGTVAIVKKINYYPFGLTQKGYNNLTTSLGSAGAKKYQYNGKELQDDYGLDWYDYGARFYDAGLGRWHILDKLSGHPNQISKSPYQYAWNNPIKLNDPDGNCPWCIIGAVIGAAVDYGSQVAVNYATGNENPWTDVNGTTIVASALAGAATGGLSSLAAEATITTTRAVAGGMIVNAAESMTKQQATEGTISPTQVVVDIAIGQLADGVSTKNVMPTKQIEKQLDRAVRVAGVNPRASRAAAVATAQGELNTAKNVNQAVSVTTSKVVEKVVGGVISMYNSNGSNAAYTPAPMVMPADNTKVVTPLLPNFQ